MIKVLIIVGGFVLLFFMFGCKKGKLQIDTDIEAIESHLLSNNITAQRVGNLFVKIDDAGTGENPKSNSLVLVHYRGRLLNGTEFDSSFKRGQPLEIGLNSVIKGWQEGIPLFKRGGKGTLYIPSDLGYGSRAQGSIPANSVLIFDIELLDFR